MSRSFAAPIFPTVALVLTAVVAAPASGQDGCESTTDPEGDEWRKRVARRADG